jgi:hypothetical protein
MAFRAIERLAPALRAHCPSVLAVTGNLDFVSTEAGSVSVVLCHHPLPRGGSCVRARRIALCRKGKAR